MKNIHVFVAVLALSLGVAACGGGGGSTPPISNPGGGGAPPSSSPTSSPSSSPTSAPSSAPTTVPTNPPVTGSIAANSTLVSAEPNFINGSMSWYTQGTASWSNHAGDTSSGGSGQTIDGVPCLTGGMGGGYHVHAFVGIFANGVWEAIPQAIGMEKAVEPTVSGQPTDTDEILAAQCFYKLHTHDYSGLIHVEDPTQPQLNGNFNVNESYATLQTLFDEWGEPISATGVATFMGPVSVYVGYPTTKDGSGNDLVNSYSLSTAAPSQIMLQHHTAYWIVIGALPANGLPQVRFLVEQ